MPLNQLWLARQPKDPHGETIYCQAGEDCRVEINRTPSNMDEDPSEITPFEVVVRARIERHRVSWHPKCWLEVYIPLVEARPYNATGPGRRPLDLSDNDRRSRKLVQNKHASFSQRINQYTKRVREDDEEGKPTTLLQARVAGLLIKQALLWWEIQKYGGAPDVWKVPEGGEDFLRDRAEKEAVSS